MRVVICIHEATRVAHKLLYEELYSTQLAEAHDSRHKYHSLGEHRRIPYFVHILKLLFPVVARYFTYDQWILCPILSGIFLNLHRNWSYFAHY